MLDTIIYWDHRLFELINGNAIGPFFEWYFPLITDFHKTMVFKVFVLPMIFALIFLKLRKRGFVFIFMLLLAAGTSDLIGGKVLKPIFARDRPNAEVVQLESRGSHYGGKSFPSNHAFNIFTICVFCALAFRKAALPLIVLAMSVAYSRVYVGVHYPLDITVGALLGILIGFLYNRLWKFYLRKADSGEIKWLKF